MKTINLGYEGPDYSGIEASPVSTKEEPKTKTHYPSLYLSECPPELMNLPDEGEALITFKVVAKNMRKSKGDDAKTGCELEITSITPNMMDKPMDSGGQSDAEDAFDKYMGGSEEDGE